MTRSLRTIQTSLQRVPRGEANRLAARMFMDTVGSAEGRSIGTSATDERLGFFLKIETGPVVSFSGYNCHGKATFVVSWDEVRVVEVTVEPRVFVEPSLFKRRLPILDYKARPTVTEPEFVSEVATRYREVYDAVVARAEGLFGTLPKNGMSVAALKASAFIAACERAHIPPLEWTPEAEKATLSTNPVEAEIIRRIVNSESVAAMTGREMMRGPKRPVDLQ